MKRTDTLNRLRHGVIVSVQAEQGEPLYKTECLAAMAMSAINGGACALRLANAETIEPIREHLPDVPVIGITKPHHLPADPENHVYITPTLWTAESVIQAGAAIVAMDATQRPRPDGEALETIVRRLRERFPDVALMADIATEAEALAAAELGFDVIGTTLSGYTAETLDLARTGQPDFNLLARLCENLATPVILEGRVWTPEHVSEAFRLGAFSVVVGSAVTRPQLITRRFVAAAPTLHAAH